MTTDILIVDDETDIREIIADILKDENYGTRTAEDSDGALKALAERVPSCLILDIWLQGSELDGLGILEIVQKKYPHLPVIMISGHGNIETAVNAIKMGAYDFIEKPFQPDRLTGFRRHHHCPDLPFAIGQEEIGFAGPGTAQQENSHATE